MLDNEILETLIYDYDVTKEDLKHLSALIELNEVAEKYNKAFSETLVFKLGQHHIVIEIDDTHEEYIHHDGEWRCKIIDGIVDETHYVSLTPEGIGEALKKKYCLENDIPVDTDYTLEVLNAFVKTADKAVRDYEDILGHVF